MKSLSADRQSVSTVGHSMVTVPFSLFCTWSPSPPSGYQYPFPGLCKLWHCTNSTSDLRIKFDSVRKHTHTHTYTHTDAYYTVCWVSDHIYGKMYFKIEIKTCLRIEEYFLLSDSNCLDLPFLLGVHWHWHWRRKHRLKEVFTLFYSGSIAKQNRSWWQGATKKSNCSKRRDKNYFKLLVECYHRSFTNRKPPVDS